MAAAMNDFFKSIIDEVESYKYTWEPVKANPVERMMKRMLSPEELHPNPADEFTHPDVGPSERIVQKYKEEVLHLQRTRQDIFEEPIIVEKMKPSGYMLINGHHRWAAALQMGVKKIHVSIVNLTHEEDIRRMLENSKHDRVVSFDLEEVVFVPEGSEMAEELPRFIDRVTYKENIRKGFPAVVKGVEEKGYDVWVYTSSYHSEDYIRKLFKEYDIEVTGVVNGVGQKMSEVQRNAMKELFNKYQTKIHIDGESVTTTHTNSKEFDQTEVSTGENWAESVLAAVR